jgi:hypothetical protein
MADKKKTGPVGKLIKVFVGLLVVLLLIGAGAFIYGYTLESKRTFKSEVLIKADSDDIHKYIGDLKQWPEWGPWKDEDPTMTWEFSPKTDEVGSWMSWTSEKPRNNGRLEITSADEDKGIEYKISFDGSDAFPGAVRYTKKDDGYNVEWSVFMDAGSDIGMRYFMKFGEGLMTEMFEQGLAKLKTKAEAE